MKNKTKLLILSIIASLTFTSALASCGKKGGDGGNTQSSSSSVVDGSSENESSSVVDGSSENESSSVVDGSSENESSVTVTISGGATIAEFESVTLMATVMGAEEEVTVEWSSSDESIATVDQNGVVTAKKIGNVVITAAVGGVSATHALEVTATPYMHEIEFDIDEVNIYEGEEETVEAYVVFNGEELDNEEFGLTYTWEKVSGDDVVTLVADGAAATFTASATGTAVYKVTTVARGYEVSKTITVTVAANEYSYEFTNDKIALAGDAYQAGLTLVSDATLTIGDVIGVKNGEPQSEDVLTVTWATESDVISVEDGVITALKAGEGAITGTASYQGEDFTITLNVSVAKNQVAIENKTLSIEAITDKMDISALTEDIAEEIKGIKIGDLTVFSGLTVASEGEIALAARPVKAADLGEGKTMTIETDTTFYTVNVDVYTMIINNAEELDQWQAIAAQNAVDAGLCIAEQKGLVYSGYFILGDNIEYNKVWNTYAGYAKGVDGYTLGLYNLCYANDDIWVDGIKDGTLKEGAIQEDWGAGRQGGFQGTFDGAGHYINGLQTSRKYSGFIVTMGVNGLIKDVAFTNAKIGTSAGLLSNRGTGSYENIFVEVAEMESGLNKDDFTVVVTRGNGSGAEIHFDNILVDLSKIDFASLQYSFVSSLLEDNANGIYAIGVNGAPLNRHGWEAGSNNNGAWDEKQATVFYRGEANDVVGAYANAADLLADETNGAVVKAWNNDFWTVTDTAVIPQSVADLYDGTLEITNENTNVNAGTSITVTTSINKAYVALSLKEAVDGVTLNGTTVSVAEEVAIGTKFTVVATSLLDGSTFELEFTSAPKIVAHDYTTTVEVYNNNTIALPTDLEGEVSKVSIGSVVVYDAANAIGSLDGTTVTAGAMPAKMSDLGDSVKMTVETSAAKYEMYISVYTMIIDNVEELNQWYTVSGQTAIDAGICIEAQRNFVLSGYIVLGADIEYNNVWTHIPYGTRWAQCYNNTGIWVNGIKDGTLVEGAIVEDWGAGLKGGFQGVFDGKGHSIQGMEIKGEYAGFIGTMGSGGVFKNVAFTDLKIGSKAGLVERGNNGGLIENVYVDMAAFESGTGNTIDATARVFPAHGKTDISNVIVNVTDCDFTGIEYVNIANFAYVSANNVYVIDKDYLRFATAEYTDGSGPVAFRAFDEKNDKGAKFATVAGLLADETHGAIVSNFGGYWTVEDGKLYFGDLEVATAPEKEFILDEYKTNADKQVTLASESFTVGSVWSMSINGGEAVDVEITEEGQATVSIDAATLPSYQAKVVFSTSDKVISFSNVIAVTYISTAEELKAIGVGGQVITVDGVDHKIGNGAVADAHVAGYYILADDIDCTGVEFAAGYAWTNARFKGVFDGNGKTLSNVMVGDGGIFGAVEGAVIKNVNFENVLFHGAGSPNLQWSSDKSGTGLNNNNQWGLYTAILGYSANNVEVSDVTIELTEYYYNNASLIGRSSLLFGLNHGTNTYKNITIDATGVSVGCLLGAYVDADETYTNVSIKAGSYQLIGKSEGMDSNTAVTELPAGVTFELALIKEAAVTKNGDSNAIDLTTYEGDVTELGFAAGTTVLTQYIETSNNGWPARALVTTNPAFDYVDIQFALDKTTGSFTVWTPDVAGSYAVTLSGCTANEGAPERKIQILEADGSATTDTALAANKVYTLRVYLGLGETSVTVSAFHSATEAITIYYNATAIHGFDAVADAE